MAINWFYGMRPSMVPPRRRVSRVKSAPVTFHAPGYGPPDGSRVLPGPAVTCGGRRSRVALSGRTTTPAPSVGRGPVRWNLRHPVSQEIVRSITHRWRPSRCEDSTPLRAIRTAIPRSRTQRRSSAMSYALSACRYAGLRRRGPRRDRTAWTTHRPRPDIMQHNKSRHTGTESHRRETRS